MRDRHETIEDEFGNSIWYKWTIDEGEDEPPPTTGVREPRRPRPHPPSHTASAERELDPDAGADDLVVAGERHQVPD